MLYSRWESNPHSRKNWILNPARLPVPPLEHYLGLLSRLSFSLPIPDFQYFSRSLASVLVFTCSENNKTKGQYGLVVFS
jgi:hypothetical protein